MSTLSAEIHANAPLKMGLEEAIRTRRSVHYFTQGAPLAEAQWRKLFELTALSPSSFNFQPWDFVVVEDEARRQELQALCWGQRQVVDSSAVIAVLGDKDPHRRDKEVLQQFQDNGYIDEDTQKAYLGAVDVVYPDEARKIEHAVGGACLAAMTLMLAAHGMGLATLPMIGFDPDGVQKFFNVPDDYIVTMLIAIGYSADKELPRQQRRGFDDIVYWDRFETVK
ncbi:nitroreductase family protein [Thiohalomonas denitrificans]|uniref:nitroreductase family protein n=1 Tax=Thiohalomonas denitrificans TaxID=415747 RepID=UPI0026F19F3E|nr:nitroreductase family protein [Thiohalomonas denitrificans]